MPDCKCFHYSSLVKRWRCGGLPYFQGPFGDKHPQGHCGLKRNPDFFEEQIEKLELLLRFVVQPRKVDPDNNNKLPYLALLLLLSDMLQSHPYTCQVLCTIFPRYPN